METVETVEAVETVETVEAVETVETVEAVETVETVEAVETVETVEAVDVVATRANWEEKQVPEVASDLSKTKQVVTALGAPPYAGLRMVEYAVEYAVENVANAASDARSVRYQGRRRMEVGSIDAKNHPKAKAHSPGCYGAGPLGAQRNTRSSSMLVIQQ